MEIERIVVAHGMYDKEKTQMSGVSLMNFAERYGPWAVVAGASEGTGRSFARKIAAGKRVFDKQ
jgi:hypothetical protein